MYLVFSTWFVCFYKYKILNLFVKKISLIYRESPTSALNEAAQYVLNDIFKATRHNYSKNERNERKTINMAECK